MGLDETGWQQVRHLAQRFVDTPVRAILTSPLERCEQTAQALADVLPGVVPQREDRLGECRYGAWTSRPITDLGAEPLWQTVQHQPSAARFPDSPQFPGESIAAMAARAVAVVRETDARLADIHGQDAAWVAVSHGDVIKAVLADAAGTHLDLFQRFVVDPASVSVIRYTAGRPFVIRVNDGATSLGALLQPPPATQPSDGPAATGHLTGSGDAVIGGGAGHG